MKTEVFEYSTRIEELLLFLCKELMLSYFDRLCFYMNGPKHSNTLGVDACFFLLGLPSCGVLPCFSDLGPFLDLATIFLMHFHSSLENHTCLQSKMGKFCIHFQTKMAQKPYPLGRHVPTSIWLTQGSPPGTVFNFYQFLLMLAGKAKPVQCVLPHCTVYQHHCWFEEGNLSAQAQNIWTWHRIKWWQQLK